MLRGFLGHSMCYNGKLYEADKGNNAAGGQAQTSGANAGAQDTSGGEGAQAKKTEPGKEGDPAGSDTSGTQDGKQESTDGQPKTYTQAEIDAIVSKRLTDEKERETRAAQREQRKKTETDLASKEEWKTLSEQRGTTITSLEAENDRLRTENAELKLGGIRANVAAKYKLPARLVDRIRGATEAEMDADAKALAAEIGPPKAPATEGGAGVTTATATATGQGSSDPPPPPAATGQQNGQQQQQPLYGWQSRTDVRW